MPDLDTDIEITGEDEFTPEEQAAFEAMESAPEESTIEQDPVEPAEQEPSELDSEPDTGEPEKTDELESKKGDPTDKTVPLAALHQERIKRQERDRELQAIREKFALLEGRTQQILDAQNKKEPEPEVTPEDDPYQFMQQQQGRIEQLEQIRQAEMQQQQQQQQFQSIIQAGNQQASMYREEIGGDTYDAAMNYVVEGRKRELAASGRDEMTIGQIINQEIQGAIIDAVSRNVNPGQMMHEIAKARGFTTPQVEQKPVSNDKLKQQTRGLGTAASTSRASKAGSVEDLINMSEDEFERLYAGEDNDEAFGKLLGV